MVFPMVYKSGQIFLPFSHNSRVWRTDGRTDSLLIAILVCIPCSSVKTNKNIFGMTWPARSLDLNLTENVCLAVELKLRIETDVIKSSQNASWVVQCRM